METIPYSDKLPDTSDFLCEDCAGSKAKAKARGDGGHEEQCPGCQGSGRAQCEGRGADCAGDATVYVDRAIAGARWHEHYCSACVPLEVTVLQRYNPYPECTRLRSVHDNAEIHALNQKEQER